MTLTVADTAYSIAAVRADERELFEDRVGSDFTIDGFTRPLAAAKRSRVVFTFGTESYAERVTKLGFTLREEVTLDAVWRRHLPGEPDAGASYSRVAIIEALRSGTG